MYAFADAFENTFILEHNSKFISNESILLHMFTDSKFFFDVIAKCSHTEEKRLIIVNKNVKNAYHSEDSFNRDFQIANNLINIIMKIKKHVGR